LARAPLARPPRPSELLNELHEEGLVAWARDGGQARSPFDCARGSLEPSEGSEKIQLLILKDRLRPLRRRGPDGEPSLQSANVNESSVERIEWIL
jgi:hypothetical protein